jgi:predicted amidophosphoribosyltransferase
MTGEHDETGRAVQREDSRFCRVCGDDLRPGAAFCSRCGAPVGPQASPPSRRRVAVAAGLVILAVVLLCAGAALAHQHDQDVATANAAATATTVAGIEARQSATAAAVATANAMAQQTANAIAQQTATAVAAQTATAIARGTATAAAAQSATAGVQATALAQATANAQATVQARAARLASRPVRVCPAGAVGADHVRCAQPYSSISAADWPGARLSCTSAGQTFTSTDMHFAIAITRDGGLSFANLGTLDTNTTDLSAGAESYGLAAIFAGASVAPQDGATYQVEVDNGAVLVGTVEFTYTVAGASSADTSVPA